jgi:signal transduction histidine kinase/CheY-like chemotaxis protein
LRNSDAPRRRWPLVAAFGFAAAALVASASVMVASMRADAVRLASDQLEAIGALKVAAIESWIEDRIIAARYACTYPSVVMAGRAAIAGRADEKLRVHVQEVLDHFAGRWGHELVGLLDGAGRPIAIAGREATVDVWVDRWFLETALADPRGASARLDVGPDAHAKLEVAVVSRFAEGTFGFCVLRADATSLVDAAVETWPVPSDSGSAALLRVDRDAAVLLLRRRERLAEGLVRVPLAQGDRAAVRAVRGERALIEGRDRFGVPMMIRARPVPGTDWILRTRLDRAEILAPLRRATTTIIGLVVAFLIAGTAMLVRWWRDEGRRAEVERELNGSRVRLELSQRMAGLGRLAAGVAHEVNNPLSSVVANLAFVAEELPDAPLEVRQALREARDGAERVADVVRGLKTFSRPGDAARGPIDVREEVGAALRLARHELRHRATVRVQLEPVPPVVADAHELGQVFLNLLVNAAQAFPEGRADEHLVTVSTRTGADGWALVEIADNGVGIPPKVLDRIFEPFFTTKPLGVGTGLGLAIAHGIVTNAGGRIEVESRVGQGSTFRVLLPRAPGAAVEAVAALPAPATAQEPAAAPKGGSAARVLIVDDEPIVARAAVRVLAGYDVLVVNSAGEALRLFESGERYDAVLCDLMMPQMTGMELHARVAAFAPDLAARFVFITGGAFTDAAEEFLRTTPNGWIEKPFDRRGLRSAVERAIGGTKS